MAKECNYKGNTGTSSVVGGCLQCVQHLWKPGSAHEEGPITIGSYFHRMMVLELCCAINAIVGAVLHCSWCVTYKSGKSLGRHGCFGRVLPEIVQSTVVTRAEPHNLQVGRGQLAYVAARSLLQG